MPASINFKQKLIIGQDRNSAVQTALSGNTVYSLPKWTPRRNMVDLVLMIMDEDGPVPMHNMRPAKKTRNAADQFEAEQQGEYEARGQSPRDQIERVRKHNNAYPRMYDELEKRRSIAQVGISTGFDNRQFAFRGAATYSCNSSDQSATYSCNSSDKSPKCNNRKKRLEDQNKKGRNSKKCKDKRSRKESRNKLDRVTKQRGPKPRKQQSKTCRSTTKSFRPCVICSNKCFQCYLAAETKSVSTFKSNENLSIAMQQEINPPNLTSGINIRENNEKIVLNRKSSHKKKVAKKPGSSKSEEHTPDKETEPSVSSYNSFLSAEHEPMVE